MTRESILHDTTMSLTCRGSAGENAVDGESTEANRVVKD